MKNILLFIGFSVATWLGIECFLKFARITPPTLKYYNEKYGSLNRPNIEYFKSVEGLYVGSTNYDGRFRENYPRRKTDKHTLRILLVGDSFVEGIDVFSHNHFANYMENILGRRLHCKVEILNFGRGNCTLAASSYYFINYISQRYDADIVLYFTEGRDIASAEDQQYPSTSFMLDSNGQLVASYSWKKAPEYRIHEKLIANPVLKYYDDFSYFNLLYRAWARVKISGMALMTFGKFVGQPLHQDYSDVVNNNALTPLAKKLYDTVDHYMNGQMIFVVRNKPVYTPAIMEYMTMKGYPYLDLNDTFDNYYIRGTNVNAYYFKASNSYGGHWNNEGHRAVAWYLSNKICEGIDTFKMPNYER